MAKKKSSKRKVKKAKQKKAEKATIRKKSQAKARSKLAKKKVSKKTSKKKAKSQKVSIKKRASPKRRLKKAKAAKAKRSEAKKKKAAAKKRAWSAKKKKAPKIRIVRPKPVEVITFEQQVERAKPSGEFHKHVESIDKEIAEYKKALEAQEAAHPVQVISATGVEKKGENVEKELKRPGKKGPIIFYLLSSLVCIAILAYLFGTVDTGIFFFLFGMFLWWWSHRFHITRSGAWKAFSSLGILIIFLYVFYWYFNDLLSLLVLVLYAMSIVIAGFLYFYHAKRELSGEIHRSFERTLLVMFYSHIMAFTVASALAYALSYVLFSDSFVSIAFVILAWLLPCLLVYFFLTKFLYLRFFDRKHIKRDLKKGIVHGALYCFILIILLLAGYLLTAFQFAGEEQMAYDEAFNTIFDSLSSIEQDISGFAAENDAGEILDLKVTKDLESLSGQMLQGATDLKAELDVTHFSFDDYLSDNYFTELSQNRIVLSRTAGVAHGIDDLKQDLFREYLRVKDFQQQGLFDDNTTTLEEHYYMVASYANDVYSPYKEPEQFTQLREKVSDNMNSYSGLFSDEALFEFNLVYHENMDMFTRGKSRFSQRFLNMMYHTAVFRDFMVLVFNNILSQWEETVDPYPVRYIYSAVAEESTLSGVLRYRIVKSNIDATLSLSR